MLDGFEFSFLEDYVSPLVFDEGDDVAYSRFEFATDLLCEGDSEAWLHAAVGDDSGHVLLSEFSFGRSYYVVFCQNGIMVCFKFFQVGFCAGGRLTKVAFVVLTCNENENTGLSDVELQQELERTITETRTIDGKWTVEKVTVLEDP